MWKMLLRTHCIVNKLEHSFVQIRSVVYSHSHLITKQINLAVYSMQQSHHTLSKGVRPVKPLNVKVAWWGMLQPPPSRSSAFTVVSKLTIARCKLDRDDFHGALAAVVRTTTNGNPGRSPPNSVAALRWRRWRKKPCVFPFADNLMGFWWTRIQSIEFFTGKFSPGKEDKENGKLIVLRWRNRVTKLSYS